MESEELPAMGRFWEKTFSYKTKGRGPITGLESGYRFFAMCFIKRQSLSLGIWWVWDCFPREVEVTASAKGVQQKRCPVASEARPEQPRNFCCLGDRCPAGLQAH